MEKIKRREFLNNICPNVALALLGVSLLEACSKEDDPIDQVDGENGYTVNGNSIEIDLSHPFFNILNTQGWMNFTAQKTLLLKIGFTYSAYSNLCPHQGTRDAWSYNSSENIFVCGRHNNSYPTDCISEGTNGGPLQCFNVNKTGNILTVIKS